MVEIASCLLKDEFKKLSPFRTRERLNAKIKMPMRALNLLDLGKNIKVSFFSN